MKPGFQGSEPDPFPMQSYKKYLLSTFDIASSVLSAIKAKRMKMKIASLKELYNFIFLKIRYIQNEETEEG